MNNDQFALLLSRLGREHVGRRMMLQARHSANVYGGRGRLRLHPENSELLPMVVGFALRLTGLAGLTRRNCLEYRVERQTFPIRNLPEPFHGLRILHLSDIHADVIPDQGAGLAGLLEKLHGTYDLCVLTGDYRFQTSREYDTSLKRLVPLLEPISCPLGVIGILGNHDFLEMVPGLEALGVRMLINEALFLERGGRRIWIAGTDDPHFYAAQDIAKALSEVPASAATILLCHSPEAQQEAALSGIDLYLCGHTHGGQLCLPGGLPVITNAAVPRRYVSGPWKYDRMLGYTSRGAGASGLPARLNCPPEVAIHVLARQA
ncbi:metallophosphoesterase [Desulfonatronum parangueonense]